MAATVGAGDGLPAPGLNGGNVQPLVNEWGNVSEVYRSTCSTGSTGSVGGSIASSSSTVDGSSSSVPSRGLASLRHYV